MSIAEVLPRRSKSASLELKPRSDLVVLTPNIGRLDEPRLDSSIAGTVLLHLPKEAKIKTLVVELVGKQDVLIQRIYHSYTVFNQRVNCSAGQQVLPAGDHEFAFEIVIPADSAPYDTCEYGKTTYRLLAAANVAGNILSASRKIGIQTNHTENRDEIPSFSAISKSTNEHLGGIGISLSAQYLLVAGYLNLTLDVREAKCDIRLEDVRVTLVQYWELSSLEIPVRKESPEPQSYLLWSMGDIGPSMIRRSGSPLPPVKLSKGQSFHLQRRFVLPEHDTIRPSTSSRSKTGLRASHKLIVKLLYTPILDGTEMGRKETTMQVPALLSACWCVMEALQLPRYEKHAAQDEARLAFKACDARARCLYD